MQFVISNHRLGFPIHDKESACNAEDIGDTSSIPGLGRSPGGGDGNPLQYSCLKKFPWTEEPGGLQSMGSPKNWTGLSD